MAYQYHSPGSYSMPVKPLGTFFSKVFVAYSQRFINEEYFRCHCSRYGKTQAGPHA